jgi:hypothetical protein
MRFSTTLSLLCFMMGAMEVSGMYLFTNLLYMIGICKSEGGICGPVDCKGPLHPPSCKSSSSGSGSGSENGEDGSFEEESSYEAIDGNDFTASAAGGLPAASARMSYLPFIIAAVIGAMFVGLYAWKKRVSLPNSRKGENGCRFSLTPLRAFIFGR